jgi:hypothetical protein
MGRVSVVADAWADPDADRWSASPVLCQAQARDCRSAADRDFLWAKKAEPVRRGVLQRHPARRPQDEGPTAEYPTERQVVLPQESQDVLQAQRAE